MTLDFSDHTRTEADFLVDVLDVGMIFVVKFQCVRAQNMSFWPVGSDYSAQITLETCKTYTFALGSDPGHDVGTISETIKNPASDIS